MGREEQIEEREVLDSIFPDEITGEKASRTIVRPRLMSPLLQISRRRPIKSQ